MELLLANYDPKQRQRVRARKVGKYFAVHPSVNRIGYFGVTHILTGYSAGSYETAALAAQAAKLFESTLGAAWNFKRVNRSRKPFTPAGRAKCKAIVEQFHGLM